MQPNQTPAPTSTPAPSPTPKPTPVSDVKPTEPAAPAPAGKSLWKIFSIISLGALTIAVVAGILTVLNVTNAKDLEIVTLKNQVTTLEARIAELGGFDETDPDQKFVEFPTLGVRVPVSAELAEKLSVEAIEVPGTTGAYAVNYGTCKSAFGIVYNSSLTESMGLAGVAGAPRILVGDIYTALVTPQELPCDSSELDLTAFTADNQAWLAALDNIEAYEVATEEPQE